MQITRLTSSGKESSPAISPDGKYFVYVDGVLPGKQSLVLKQISGLSSRELIPATDILYTFLTFSPDGEFIYYSTLPTDNDSDKKGLFRISVLGGEALRLLDKAISKISFAPDGDRFVYADFTDLKGPSLNIASMKELIEHRSQPKTIAVRHDPEYFNNPAWSPDGSLIACIFGNERVENSFQIIGFTPDGKEQPPLTKQNWKYIESLQWLKNSEELFFTAKATTGNDLTQIWRAGKDGEARQITNDLYVYLSLGLSADGKLLTASQSGGQSHVNVGEATSKGQKLFFDNKNFKQVTRGVNVIHAADSLAWAPDGKIIYGSKVEEESSEQLFQINADGSGNKKLTQVENLDPAHLSVTSDNRFVLFSWKTKGIDRIWRLNLADSSLKQLTLDETSKGDFFPSIIPNSKDFIYNYLKPDGQETHYLLRKISVEGGESELLDLNGGYDLYEPSVSPDGKSVAFVYFDKDDDGINMKIGILPLSNTKLIPKIFPVEARRPDVKWTPDSRAVVYVQGEKGAMNLRAVPIDGSNPYDLTNFTDSLWLNQFDFSLDGKRLAVARGPVLVNVVLIKNFN